MFKYIFFFQYILVRTEVEVKQEMLSQRCHNPLPGCGMCLGWPCRLSGCCDWQSPRHEEPHLGELAGPAVSLLADSDMPPTSVPD